MPARHDLRCGTGSHACCALSSRSKGEKGPNFLPKRLVMTRRGFLQELGSLSAFKLSFLPVIIFGLFRGNYFFFLSFAYGAYWPYRSLKRGSRPGAHLSDSLTSALFSYKNKNKHKIKRKNIKGFLRAKKVRCRRESPSLDCLTFSRRRF